MSFPGINILGMANRVIKPQEVMHVRWLSDASGDGGVAVPKYATPVKIKANVQPVPRTMYEALGLDLQRDYITVYTQIPLRDLRRGQSPDLIDWQTRRYTVESNTEWQAQDGWHGSICVDSGAAPP